MIMENELQATELLQVAEVELVYRNFVKPSQRPRVSSSGTAYRYFLQTWEEGQLELAEHFKIMLLNRCGRILGIMKLSAGGVSGTIVDPKLVFAAALKANASALILAHNHPSGNLNPSQPDLCLTRKLIAAGQLLDIGINDHLVITAEGYYSFADEGVL